MPAPQWIAAVLIEDPSLITLRMEVIFVRYYGKNGAKRLVDRALREAGKLIGFDGRELKYEIARIEECREGREDEMQAEYARVFQKAANGRGHIIQPEQ